MKLPYYIEFSPPPLDGSIEMLPQTFEQAGTDEFSQRMYQYGRELALWIRICSPGTFYDGLIHALINGDNDANSDGE